MGQVKLDPAGLKKLRHMMEQRVLLVQMELAREAMYFLLNFGYHKDGGGKFMSPEENQGWTEYYAANWNVGIGNPDLSVIQPLRGSVPGTLEKDDYIGELSSKKESGNYEGKINTVAKGQSIWVTNAVWYGERLNDGDYDVTPNRFIELCRDHLDGQKDRIIKESKEAIPL